MADTWSEVLDLNRAFIRDETRATTYHSGPLLPDSAKLQTNLLNLHDYGLLTVDGQGPLDDRGCYADTDATDLAEFSSMCPVVHEARPGNSVKLKGCSHCNARLANRLERSAHAKRDCNHNSS